MNSFYIICARWQAMTYTDKWPSIKQVCKCNMQHKEKDGRRFKSKALIFLQGYKKQVPSLHCSTGTNIIHWRLKKGNKNLNSAFEKADSPPPLPRKGSRLAKKSVYLSLILQTVFMYIVKKSRLIALFRIYLFWIQARVHAPNPLKLC